MKPIPLIYPPREVFLFPENVFDDFENNPIAKNGLSYEDIYKITRVELPKEGGILFYSLGRKYPYKGFPFAAVCNNLGVFKRSLVVFLRYTLKNPLVLTSFIFKKNRQNFIKELEHLSNGALHKYYLKPERFCRMAREFYRLAGIIGLSQDLKYMICMLLEFDNAYRFRAQILAQMIDKKLLKSKSRYVIMQILDFAIQSETDQRLKQTWRAIQFIFKIAWFLPKTRKTIKILINEIKLDEILPDEGDKEYYMNYKQNLKSNGKI